MAGSFTDFHIDFGGTSVWYHILHGRKRFYFIAPTTQNLNLFTRWALTADTNPAMFFFGDQVPEGHCMTFDLTPGETLIIPSGWIHAVYTPEDALVFGGNFVHSYSILRQLQVNCIEQRTKVKKVYRFPYFKQINWYFLCALLPVAHQLYMNISIESKEKELCSGVGVREVSPCAGEIESDASNSDDDGEEEEDLVRMANQLILPAVFNQLPFLVKSCELWIQSKALDSAEDEIFQAAAEDAGYSSPSEVISEWWDVLKHIAALIAVEIFYSDPAMRTPQARAERRGELKQQKKAFAPTIQCSDEFSVISSWHYQHVLRIQRMSDLDLLSDSVVGGIDPEFDRYVSRLLASNKGEAVEEIFEPMPPMRTTQQPAVAQEKESYDEHGFLEVPQQPMPSLDYTVETAAAAAAAAAVAETSKRKAADRKAAARKFIRV